MKPAPLFDDTYTGPRWRYGLVYRPITADHLLMGLAIIKSDRSDMRFRHGTVDFPRPLTDEEISAHELVEIRFVMTEDGRVPTPDPGGYVADADDLSEYWQSIEREAAAGNESAAALLRGER